MGRCIYCGVPVESEHDLSVCDACRPKPLEPDREMTEAEFRTELLALLGELSETWRAIVEDIQKICKEKP